MSTIEATEAASYTTVVSLVQKWAATDPDTPAFVFLTPSQRLCLSRHDVLRLASRCAAVLRRQGVRQGHVVSNTLPNSPERLLTDLGIMLAGGVAMNGQVFLKDGDDLVGSLKAAKCVGIIVDPQKRNSASDLLKERQHEVRKDGSIHFPDMPDLKYVFDCCQKPDGERKPFLEILEEENETFVCENMKPDDHAVVWTTSGSTGFSKLVPLSHYKVLLFSNTYYNMVGLRPGENFYNDRPFGWAGGFLNCFLTHGSTRVLVDFSREPVEDHFAFVWQTMVQERCTVSYMVPYCIENLVEHVKKLKAQAEGGEPSSGDASLPLADTNVSAEGKAASSKDQGHQKKQDFSTKTQDQSQQGNQASYARRATAYRLRILACGGQPLKKAHLAALGTLTDVIRVVYGATETGLMAWKQVEKAEEYESCNSGLPVPGMQLKVVDDEEKEVGSGQMGQILVKSKQAFLGYLNDEASTQKAFTSDGWIRTGDVGHKNDKGEVFVVCRKSNSIIRGAHLVYPGWLETRMARYPGVQNVMVVPVPDPILHQELCACVVTVPGAEVTEEGLREYCRGLFLTDEKDHMTAVPKYFLFFPALPVNTTGKTCRRSTTAAAREKLGLTDE